ncbi:MAG: HAAS signaling domain-containing protein [Planctomycetota bacterium]|jgi:hypothetical protein
MSEQEFETYLDQVCARLGLSRWRRDEIRDELRAHLDEHWEEISGAGQSRQGCIARVLDEFGPPQRLAAAITRPYQRRVRRIAGVLAASLAVTVLIQAQLRSRHSPTRHPWAGSVAQTPLLAGTGGALLAQLTGGSHEAVPKDDALRAFSTRIPVVSFDDEPLESVFDTLGELTDANIWINWGALESVGVDKDTLVSIRLRDITLGRLLDLLCAQVGGLDDDVRFGQSDNVIEISTRDALRSPTPDIDTVQVVYDVRGILDAAETRWRKDVQEQARRDQEDPPCFPVSETSIQDDLRDIITTSIAADMWLVNGGTQGSIEHFAGLLVIRAPSVVHGEIADLLQQLDRHLAPGSVRSSAAVPAPMADRVALPGGRLAPEAVTLKADGTKKKDKKQKKHKKAKEKRVKKEQVLPGGKLPGADSASAPEAE